MKLSLTRWIEPCALALALGSAASAQAAPEVIECLRLPTRAEPRVIAYLQEPAPPATLPSLPRTLPTEITVLSPSAPGITVIKPLPEPQPSASAKPAAAASSAAAAAAAAPKPAASAPATSAPAPAAAAAAAAPKPAASAPAATAPAATAPKPAASAPAASAPVATAPARAPVAPATAAAAQAVQPAAAPVPDVKIEAYRGERFEIRLPGSGWTYLGDEEGRDGVRFETRRFEDGEAAFALNPEKAGSYLLRFMRQDPVELSSVTKFVALSVVDRSATPTGPVTVAPGASSTLPASASPAASPAVPAASAPATAALGTATPEASGTAAAATPEPMPAALSSLTQPDAILAYARDELGASRIRTAIDALDRYVSLFPYGNDELFYLYGLAYEQDTPYRNIKKAYESYKRVRDEYPRSKRWREAADRIAYLERHYFGLR